MRIFVVTQKTPNELALPDSSLWEANLQMPLRELGHELLTIMHPWISKGYDCDPTDPGQKEMVESGRAEFCQQLIDEIKKQHQQKPIDLFFSYFSSAHVDSEAIEEIKSLGIPTVNWYCNASYQFHLIKDVAAAFDYCLVPEKFRLEDYREAGANPIYCQEAANPTVYKPFDVSKKYDVTFVGQRYGSRPTFVDALHNNQVNVRAWGPYWEQAAEKGPKKSSWKKFKDKIRGRHTPTPLPPEKCGPPLSDEALIRLYSESKISLGFSSVAETPADGSPPIKQVRLRDFEATMSGAFYMVEALDELTEFFEPDREIVFFHDEKDLVEKAKYYLKNETERESIRQAGHKRALGEHTWQHRFQSVFQKIGLAS